ncbi:MAG: flagella accessory protein C [Candidatus Woesearchaeota archaeon]
MKNISRESASMLNLLMEQIKALVEIGNNLNERTKESEKRINELSVEGEKTKEELKQFAAKMDVMEKNMEKFIGLYEVVTNQYNPFLEAGNGEEDENPDFSEDDSNEAPAQQEPASPEKKITVEDSISGQTPTVEPASESTSIPEQKTETPAQETEQNAQPQQPSQAQQPSQPAAQQPQLESSQPQQPTESKPVSAETSVPTGKPPSNGVASSGLVDISAIKKQMQENNGGSADSGSQPQETQPQQSGNAAVQEHEKPVSQPLSLSNGKSVKTVQDLFEELVYMDDNTFRNHVSDTKHEIADWVKNSLGNLQLSEKLRTLKTRSGIISEISSFIHSQPQEPPTSNDFKIGEKTVNDLEGLLDEIIYVDDNALSQIVTAQANPIADWIQNTVKNQALADELRPLSKKGDMVKAISKHLHEKNG